MKSLWTLTSSGHPFDYKFSIQVLFLIASKSLGNAHFSKTQLTTTIEIYDKIARHLNLEFDDVKMIPYSTTEFNKWWIHGKIHSYRSQNEPFVHIDNDVLLFDDFVIPDGSWDILTQSIEDILAMEGFVFHPDKYVEILDYMNGYIPEELRWASTHGQWNMENMGIFGVRKDFEMIKYYCDTVMDFVEKNSHVWSAFEDRSNEAIIIEQYLLSSIINFNVLVKGEKIEVARIFSENENPLSPSVAHSKSYSHFFGESKYNIKTLRNILRLVMDKNPVAGAKWIDMFPHTFEIIGGKS